MSHDFLFRFSLAIPSWQGGVTVEGAAPDGICTGHYLGKIVRSLEGVGEGLDRGKRKVEAVAPVTAARGSKRRKTISEDLWRRGLTQVGGVRRR